MKQVKYAVGILLIVAVVVVLMWLTPKANKKDPENQLGYSLFQFGKAVQAYVEANPEKHTPKDERLVYYGFEWLQPDFLPRNFSFDVSDFKVQPIELGKGPVKVVLNVHEEAFEEYFLEIELIEIGEVYRDGQPDSRGALFAANYANNHRHHTAVPDVIYRLEQTKQANGKDVAHIIGRSKQMINAPTQGITEATLTKD